MYVCVSIVCHSVPCPDLKGMTIARALPHPITFHTHPNHINKAHRASIMGDDFIRSHIGDLLRTVRTQVYIDR